ncbi:MgtC/SapB family protein [Brucella pseudogrignonensis]|uniref:MgtC/SapB family protein n=1 Tax=Brucella pseudogrignonensis TaxID=419475 RepID=UPI0028B43BEC|nr:MgtC/SapB family protein [Brucella pseudogrignonensis]MDT6940716.1 MgtC/SapB family protein [Brucella pseudogrignonensis]
MEQFQSALHQALSADNFNVWPHIITMAAAYILALPIGWHREVEERSAGLRTFPLVAVASCGFVKATEGLTADNPEALARIIEGVITGMGFIGGGAILRLSSSVKGTATAASLWATGAIGIACALNAFDVAIIIMVFALITLALFSHGKDDIKTPSKTANESKPNDPEAAG